MLSGKVAEQYQNLIKSKNATLLHLRNYLFLRQCKLLMKMKRKWEIPSRLLEFLFAAIHEFKLLKVRNLEKKFSFQTYYAMGTSIGINHATRECIPFLLVLDQGDRLLTHPHLLSSEVSSVQIGLALLLIR